MRKHRIFAGLLSTVLLASQWHVMPAWADTAKVVTLGANLSEEQKNDILRFFGVTESEVDILTITNEDEIEQLGSLIPLEKIGTRTFSCALVNPTDSGGIQVKTANMNYVTSDMIASTLSTSGVVNCDVLTAAPFEVSGTGALAGVMMAYETASGQQLDPAKKELANEELVTTETIAEKVGQNEAIMIVNDIKINVIRDDLKEQEEINTAVDTVIETTEQAAAAAAGESGQASPEKLPQEDRGQLYDFGFKVGQMNYDYEEVKVTLQRVARNVTEETGIEDPIIASFDQETVVEEGLSDDSILMNTDDAALGEGVQINATNRDTEAAAANEEQLSNENESGAAADIDGNAAVAGSGVRLQYIGSADASAFVDGTNLFLLRDDNGNCALGTLGGEAITPYEYRGFNYRDGYIIAETRTEDIHRKGVLALDGSQMVPAQYGDIDIRSPYWIVATTYTKSDANNYDYESWSDDSYYLIKDVDFYHISDGEAVLVGTLSRENMLDYYVQGDYVNVADRSSGGISMYDSTFSVIQTGLSSIYDDGGIETEEYIVYRENGHQGVKDQQGNVLIQPDYQYVYDIRNGYAQVSDGVSYGLMDLSGHLILPVIFENIQKNYYAPVGLNLSNYEGSYSANGYFMIEKDGKAGYAVQGGEITCLSDYPKDLLDRNGAVMLLTDLTGSIHIIAADGVETDLGEAYDTVNALEHCSGMLLTTYDSDYNRCLLDWHGGVLFDNEHNAYDVSGDGKYLLTGTGYDSADLYEIVYEQPSAEALQAEDDRPAAQEAQAGEERPAAEEAQTEEDHPALEEAQTEDHRSAAEEAQEDDQPAAEAAGSGDEPDSLQEARGYLESALTLAGSGLGGNSAAVSALLTEAAAALSEQQPQAAALIQSAAALLQDSNVDEDTITMLLRSAQDLLG